MYASLFHKQNGALDCAVAPTYADALACIRDYAHRSGYHGPDISDDAGLYEIHVRILDPRGERAGIIALDDAPPIDPDPTLMDWGQWYDLHHPLNGVGRKFCVDIGSNVHRMLQSANTIHGLSLMVEMFPGLPIKQAERHIWSIMTEDGSVIVNGFRPINVVGWVVTERPWVIPTIVLPE